MAQFMKSLPLIAILSIHSCCYTSATTTPHHLLSTVSATLHAKTKQPRHKQILNSIRGGSTTTSSISSDNQSPDLKWRMQQQQLLQLRSTFFSEALAARGIPLTTMLDVSTLDGEKPPEQVDWDCVMSTVNDPKVRFIFEKGFYLDMSALFLLA